MHFTLTEIWYWYAALFGIQARGSLSKSLGIKLGPIKRIWKELDGSTGDYEHAKVWKPWYDRSNNKRIPEVVVDLQVLIDNDPT